MESTNLVAEMLEEHERRIKREWYRTRWYRVVGSDDEIWIESSNLDECKEAMRPGDTLQWLWAREEMEWREWPGEEFS